MLRGTRTFGNTARRLFSTADAAGIKVHALDDGRPVTQLSLVVKAGSRYGSSPGVAHILEKFAFKSTQARSALRLVRESELLGGQLSSTLGREHVVLTTKFLREDLPYFVAALADLAKTPKFSVHEYREEVLPLAQFEAAQWARNPLYVALEAAHETAFRSGLGAPLSVQPYNPLSIETVQAFGRDAFAKANVSLVATGVDSKDLTELVGEHFADLSAGSALAGAGPTQFFGGDARVKSTGGNAVVLAFPIKAEASAAAQVLAKVLGGPSSIKWSPGSAPLAIEAFKSGTSVQANVLTYSDASLLYIAVDGADAQAVRASTVVAVQALKTAAADVNAEQLAKAQAQIKFGAADLRESNAVAAALASTSEAKVTAATVKKLAADLVKAKPVVAVAGAVHELPYLDELF